MTNKINASAQHLFEKMQMKPRDSLMSLDTITEHLRSEMKKEFNTDFAHLSYEDWIQLHGELNELITNTPDDKLSKQDKERYKVLQKEIMFRYPPQIELTEADKEKLISRDNLADEIKKNRIANSSPKPIGNIKLNEKGIEINLNSNTFIKKLEEYQRL